MSAHHNGNLSGACRSDTRRRGSYLPISLTRPTSRLAANSAIHQGGPGGTLHLGNYVTFRQLVTPSAVLFNRRSDRVFRRFLSVPAGKPLRGADSPFCQFLNLNSFHFAKIANLLRVVVVGRGRKENHEKRNYESVISHNLYKSCPTQD